MFPLFHLHIDLRLMYVSIGYMGKDALDAFFLNSALVSSLALSGINVLGIPTVWNNDSRVLCASVLSGVGSNLIQWDGAQHTVATLLPLSDLHLALYTSTYISHLSLLYFSW